jgi:hypothetical protein
MKKINKIVTLICMMVVLALTLTGCKFGKIDSKETEINKSNLEGYTEYVHSSGIKFSYPTEWKNLGTTTKPVFGDTSTGTSVNYLSESVPKAYNFTAYMTASIANVKKEMEIVGDVEEQDVKLNGKEAAIIKYTVTQSGSNVVIKQACFLDDGNAHILTVATLESNYDEQAETMDNIISSFMK